MTTPTIIGLDIAKSSFLPSEPFSDATEGEMKIDDTESGALR